MLQGLKKTSFFHSNIDQTFSIFQANRTEHYTCRRSQQKLKLISVKRSTLAIPVRVMAGKSRFSVPERIFRTFSSSGEIFRRVALKRCRRTSTANFLLRLRVIVYPRVERAAVTIAKEGIPSRSRREPTLRIAVKRAMMLTSRNPSGLH